MSNLLLSLLCVLRVEEEDSSRLGQIKIMLWQYMSHDQHIYHVDYSVVGPLFNRYSRDYAALEYTLYNRSRRWSKDIWQVQMSRLIWIVELASPFFCVIIHVFAILLLLLLLLYYYYYYFFYYCSIYFFFFFLSFLLL